MLKEISQHIKNQINNFSNQDSLIFNNKIIDIHLDNFSSLDVVSVGNKIIAFIDGGQTEIISTGNFCLSFIRVAAVIFNGDEKENKVNEFYLFTKAKYVEGDLFYESKIFGDKLIEEKDLLISSNDNSIKVGRERAPISKVINMARRFSELAMARKINADFIVLDGTLEKTFLNEEKYLFDDLCALAKSSSLFTMSGNSPVILLNKIGPIGCWRYLIDGRTSFVKLNENSKHIFRFEGDVGLLPHLIDNCNDALFLGYPYGLILADKLARVSNQEKNSLKMKFLLNSDNKEIADYLNTSNAHDILDNLG